MLHRMDISQMKYIFHYTFTIRFSLHILKRKGVNCKKKSFVWPVPSHSTSRVKTKVMEEKNVHNHNIVNISLKRLKKNIIRIFSKYYPDLSYSSSNDKFFLLYCPKSTPIIQFHWNEQVSLSNWNRIERILPVLKKNEIRRGKYIDRAFHSRTHLLEIPSRRTTWCIIRDQRIALYLLSR